MEEKAELVKIIKQKKGLLRKAEEAASVLDGFVFFLAALRYSAKRSCKIVQTQKKMFITGKGRNIIDLSHC